MKCNALFLVFHLVGGAFGQWLIGGDPNTCCPLGPFALSLPFGGIPRTCIDTETGKRCYYTYIPNCAGENSPLVYDIHGWFSCPLYNKLFSGWKQMADENCFVVVWPMGNVDESKTDLSCWAVPADITGIDFEPGSEAAPCCCDKNEESVSPDQTKDFEFLRLIASYIVRDAPERTRGRVTIDTKRIYMGGHSNGCMTALGMAMKHSDFVAAVCCHHGALQTNPADDYMPTPIWFVHGKLDDTLLYDEGTQWVVNGTTLVLNPPQVGYDYLRALNGCNSTEKTLTEDGDVQSASGCIDDAGVEFVTLEEGGHQDFETTPLAWEFCSSFESSVEPTLDIV